MRAHRPSQYCKMSGFEGGLTQFPDFKYDRLAAGLEKYSLNLIQLCSE